MNNAIYEKQKQTILDMAEENDKLHDAEVAKAAFIAGVNATGQGYNGELGLSDDGIIDLAELYVNRKVRQQAKGGE